MRRDKLGYSPFPFITFILLFLLRFILSLLLSLLFVFLLNYAVLQHFLLLLTLLEGIPLLKSLKTDFCYSKSFP
jgi:hypothetical protein